MRYRFPAGARLIRVLAAVMILAMLPMGALASFKAKVYTSSMKVYKSPSTSAKVLGTMSKGDEFTVSKVSGEWARISVKGKYGYSQIKYMRSSKRVKAYVKSPAPVYAAASSSSKKLGKLKTGKKVYLAGTSGSYYLVENSSGSVSGYVKKSCISMKKPPDSDPGDDDPDDGDKPAMPPGLESTTKKYRDSMSNSEKLEYIIYVAQNQLGKPYSANPSPPSSYDCARLMYYCFSKAKIKIPSSSYEQGYDDSYQKISSSSSLKRGDLVCFDTNDKDEDLSDHTGIYIGKGYFIHASSGGGMVMVSNLESGYYERTFSWGRRILN